MGNEIAWNISWEEFIKNQPYFLSSPTYFGQPFLAYQSNHSVHVRHYPNNLGFQALYADLASFGIDSNREEGEFVKDSVRVKFGKVPKENYQGALAQYLARRSNEKSRLIRAISN